jgi:subtilisin family serine protease
MDTGFILDPDITLESLTADCSGAGVEVAVLDSGMDGAHPALAGRIARACVVRDAETGTPRAEEIPPDSARDLFEHGHGTGVAGVILAIAPGVRLTSVQVLDAENRGAGKALLAGIGWALDQNIRLINLSLSLPSSSFMLMEPLFKLCERAYEQDAVLVASRKNIGRIGLPAQFSSVIAVDSEPAQDKYHLRFLARSLVEFAARGVDVEMPAPDGRFSVRTGTSFAAPHVTGLCALLLERFPGLLPYELKTALSVLARRTQAVAKDPATG